MSRLGEIRVAEEVLERARAGDERARAAIYWAVAPGTFGLIRRLSGNRAQAEDLFQDTMMALYQHLGQFRGEAPLGAWVRQIAVTKCLMYLRSPWHRARRYLELQSESETDIRPLLATPGPLAEVFDVERALACLSPTARAVVWLYEVEGYSHEEIGRAFGRSVSFSKSQLARAHVRLREWFEPSVDRQTCTPT
ncbi:MAG TPA: RNA polymerase sigma factor [Steroidobacteraceae bacterium]|jgi:RNA polymerase sigma-70 factor (ECF subfamily)|nr:RNA polymerase sigma factor [Steroidobacteraceae bacterium]